MRLLGAWRRTSLRCGAAVYAAAPHVARRPGRLPRTRIHLLTAGFARPPSACPRLRGESPRTCGPAPAAGVRTPRDSVMERSHA
jgi:hypothetical protein